MAKQIRVPIHPKHKLWDVFIDRLTGPEGCNFREQTKGKEDYIWTCKGGMDQTFAKNILTKMGLTPDAVDETLQFCTEHGGHCDCEILFNVDKPL
jgi:Protein of unknown function (DUF2695)